jgi:hypothetical protein
MKTLTKKIKQRKNPKSLTLYHGTSLVNAKLLLKNGWQPNKTSKGSNQGQTKYLYLTTEPLDALWFAEEKGESTILQIITPIEYLIVDPENGVGETIDEELKISKRIKFPAKFALYKELESSAFTLYSM